MPLDRPTSWRCGCFVSALVLQVVSASLLNGEADLRADPVATQIVGLAMTRYLWASDRVARMPSKR
ncbi:hypothetical protein [Catenulispora sp. GAS73]|uniref:TetR/AcrR family transcriptional regulator n=1 Tax=Catenulispora sp. GAS73 TaxID=3156269 RepID=UPI0035122112